MSVVIKGLNDNSVYADVNHNLYVNTPTDSDNSGFVNVSAESHDGVVGAARLTRAMEVSPDYRLRMGEDSLMWSDVFSHGQFNVSKYKGVDTTMTKALTGGRLALNSGNAVASGNATYVQTWRTFPLYLSYSVYADFEILFSQDPVANNVCEFGLGYATGVAVPTDGVFFRLNASGQLIGVMNNNSSETTTILSFVPQQMVVAHYLIIIHNDRVEFWINNSLYGAIETPSAIGSPTLSMNCPLLLREYNSGITSFAQRMEVASVGISTGDLLSNRFWSTTMSGMGQSSTNIPDGVASGYTANIVNSASPLNATLSNTAAGYANLGGQFQFVAPAGGETDYALFGYQVPAGTSLIPAKSLIIRGIRIETFNMGAAVATTPTLLQWSLGIGSSAVSLVTVDSATAGTRASRRLSLGIQSLPVASPIGFAAVPVDVNLDSPIMVEAGTFVHIILKIPVGTATASQIVRGIVSLNGFFE